MLDDKKYEDNAWENMLGILDKEMPVKERPSRKFLLLLLLLLFVGVGISGYLLYPSSDDLTHAASIIDNQSVENPSKADVLESSNVNRSTLTAEAIVDLTDNEVTTNVNSYDVIQGMNNTQDNSKVSRMSSGVSDVERGSKTDIVSSELVFLDKEVIHENDVLASDYKATRAVQMPQDKMSKAGFSSSVEETKLPLLQSELNPAIGLANRIPLRKNLEPFKLIAERTASLYGTAGINYIRDFENISTYAGLISEIGAEGSPWSFSSGVLVTHVRTASAASLGSKSAIEEDVLVGVNEQFFDLENEVSDLRLNYLTIPTSFHYRVNRVRFGVGLAHSILLTSNDKSVSFDTANTPIENKVDVDDRLHVYQLSLQQSISLRLGTRWDIGIHFNRDLTGIFNEEFSINRNSTLDKTLDGFGMHLAYRIR